MGVTIRQTISMHPRKKERIIKAFFAYPDWNGRKIAEYVDCSCATVYNTLNREGLKIKGRQNRTIDKVIKILKKNSNSSATMIANELGLTPNAVWACAKYYNIKLKKQVRTVKPKLKLVSKIKPRLVAFGPPQPIYFLRHKDKSYLHRTGLYMVRSKSYAWKGNIEKVDLCCIAFPLARNLYKEVVV